MKRMHWRNGDNDVYDLDSVFGGKSLGGGGGMGMAREGCRGWWFVVIVARTTILFQPIEPLELQTLTLTKESSAHTKTP